MGWGGNGWNGFGGQVGADLGNLINNDAGRELLMQAIQGNGNAISQLATTLNCTLGDVQSAINGVMSQIQGVGNQVGMSSQQIINAVQAGNCQQNCRLLLRKQASNMPANKHSAECNKYSCKWTGERFFFYCLRPSF